MPSVASEAYPVLPPRPQAPSARSHPEPDAREPATPFADLLDSAPAEPPPAPRQARSEGSERPERDDRAKPQDDRGTDAKPAHNSVRDSAGTKDSKAPAGNDGANSANDSSAVGTAEAIAEAKEGDATSAEAGGKAEIDANSLAALVDATTTAPIEATPAAVTAAPAPAVPIAQPLALAAATTGTPEADALPAMQAASGVAPNGAPKPGQASGEKPADAAAKPGVAVDRPSDAAAKPGVPADKPADAAAKPGAPADKPADAAAPTPGAPADPKAAVAPLDSAKDGQARGHGDKSAGEFHRAAADVPAKPEAAWAAAPTQGGDAGAAVKASADAMQNLGLASPPHSTPAAANAATQPQAQGQGQAQTPAVPLSGLAVAITTQAHAGNKHFEIRLDPPELGRIDIKLDVDRDGNVSTRLVVDRADTLDLLKRDASALERALQQSGLKTSDNALEFSLRQQGLARDETAAQSGAQLIIPDEDPAPLEAMRQGYGRLLGLGGGLDIRV